MSRKRIWINARLGPSLSGTEHLQDIVVEGGRIAAIGAGLSRDGGEIHDCDGRLVTPAFIDSHTHLVHGGDRAREFEMRLEGASYEEIARAGGGIAASMRDTRGLDVDGLVAQSLPRLDALLAEGCSTVEIKSGYGLTVETELTMLRAARALADRRAVRIKTTWLAAHAMPPDFDGSKSDYIHEVAIKGLDRAHAEGLVDAVDAFCEGIAFSAAEIEPLFDRARALGLPVKLHTEQLSRSGGTDLAARYGALSVDHFEYAGAEEVAAIRASGTVAVLLPGAFYMLRETRKPPLDLLRQAGVPIALATDCNPGTSPISSLLLTMNMGAVLFGMTVRECLQAVTANAARALGLTEETGRLLPGLSADFTIWDAASPAQLVNRAGFNPLHTRIFKGSVQNG
ncbi:imidazolonepropionase [Pseudodonghicola xiamenensis]|uniref:Imidazolonepropionase n=1 Tax=Pseudodonghicola xiamenensis TaxID=337702 RepID=A0A8J3H4N6_9RHOB|nr:imidazolonepropionase [Pseudodonghicola xiamenensis]GHG86257.1 imidazolonepropionase [Pseudodonghicola xiamenensis]